MDKKGRVNATNLGLFIVGMAIIFGNLLIRLNSTKTPNHLYDSVAFINSLMGLDSWIIMGFGIFICVVAIILRGNG